MRIHCKKITISDKIYIQKGDIDEANLTRLGDACTYRIKDNRMFQTIDEKPGFYTIPANAYHKLEFDEVVDNRVYKLLKHKLEFRGKLRPEQQEVLDEFTGLKGRARSGIIQAVCGFGKTYTACALIAQTSVPTLILVHTKLLLNQWRTEIENQLGITPGIVGDGQYNVQPITVGLYKSVHNNLLKLKEQFSMVIVDETHMAPAKMFSQTLCGLSAKIKIGMSATPRRVDLKCQALTDYFGPFKVVAKEGRELNVPRVALVQTDVPFNSFNPQRDWAKSLTKLANRSDYQDLITKHAIADTSKNRCILILSDRIAMLRALEASIPNSICIIGKTKEEERKEILSNAGTKYKVLLSTKLFDEGVSCHRLDTLYLISPASSTIKLEQRVGRIIREHPDKQLPLIKDFQLKGMIVSKQQLARQDWYTQQGFSVGNV